MRNGRLFIWLGLALLIGAGIYFEVPWPILAFLAVVAILANVGISWYQRKSRVFTQDILSSKPFNGKLPSEVGMATMTAVALAGDESYSQKVYGEGFFADSFEDLLEYASVPDNTVLEVQCALVVEPANQDSSHAVAVTCGGVVLGYIPEFESESLYNFLLANRGMARVNSNINLKVASKSSSVELDLTRPYKIVPGV
jgi:hypothetical protein